VPFANGKPAGKAQDVVTGFLEGDQARGRPVGVAIDGTGALLVADDAGNTVWRVAAADGSTTPEPVGSDPVSAGAAGSQRQAPPPATGVRTPSQTEIAPATSPQEGAGSPPPEQKQ
jgi:hypothetical protein